MLQFERLSALATLITNIKIQQSSALKQVFYSVNYLGKVNILVKDRLRFKVKSQGRHS